MFKMIIADDELLVRRGIRNIIPWEKYGIEIVGEASDGEEALEMCRQHKPDILFTDIRMPFLDGLEVARCLTKENMKMKIIFFSGVQDFNYAKTAVDICAEAYILKPLEIEELEEAIKKVTEKLTLEIDREKKLRELNEQLNESLGLAREKFLINLVLGVYKSDAEIIEKLNYFNIPFDGEDRFSIAVVKMDDYNLLVKDKTEADKQILNFAVINIADEIIKEYCKAVSFCKDENEFVILYDTSNFSKEEQNKIFQNINLGIKKYLRISTSVGIGYSSVNLTSLNIVYKSAYDALQFKFYTGKDSILNASDIKLDYKQTKYEDLYSIEVKLLNFIKLGDLNGEEQLLKELFEDFIVDGRYTISNVQDSCIEIIFMVLRSVREHIDGILEDNSSILEKVYKAESVYDLKLFMLDIFEKITGYYSRQYNQKNKKLIETIKGIINESYMKDISVNQIAEEVYLTPNYIGLIFKHQVGQTITDYITKVRMEAAKELLKSHDLKILDVSGMVGYEDASYFSKVFKKYTGVYPQKYRLHLEG